MNMFASIVGGLISPEQKEEQIRGVIEDALLNVSEELKCSHKEFFVMIKPHNDDCEFKCYIYKTEGNTPKLVRELTLMEIVTNKKE